jgi:hypothetical protein
MGIRIWLSNMQKNEDGVAVRRAQNEMRSGSAEERGVLIGAIEALAADNSADPSQPGVCRARLGRSQPLLTSAASSDEAEVLVD